MFLAPATEQNDDASASTNIVSVQPKSFADPTINALTALYWFEGIPKSESPELLVRDLSQAASTVKAQIPSHPRFPPEQIRAMLRREIQSVTETIKRATENLQRQAEYLEQTR